MTFAEVAYWLAYSDYFTATLESFLLNKKPAENGLEQQIFPQGISKTCETNLLTV